jgi:hypothetical protein
MNRLLVAAGVAAVFLALAPAVHAQFGQDTRYSPREVTALVDRVHDDLNQAYGAWHFSNSDRDRLNNAEKQLREFAQQWSRGKFDKGDLDDAISAIQHALDNNHMPDRDREALSDDVSRLRRMREAYDRHEIG